MQIEYSNFDISRRSSPLGGVAFAASAAVFLLVPISLITIGYYSSQPTGTLLSPMPQTILSEDTPAPLLTPASSTPSAYLPIIASDNTATVSAIDTTQSSNSSDHSATIPAGETELTVSDPAITDNSQILIIPKKEDNSTYFVKSKSEGSFVLSADTASTENRTVDYQVVDL